MSELFNTICGLVSSVNDDSTLALCVAAGILGMIFVAVRVYDDLKKRYN